LQAFSCAQSAGAFASPSTHWVPRRTIAEVENSLGDWARTRSTGDRDRGDPSDDDGPRSLHRHWLVHPCTPRRGKFHPRSRKPWLLTILSRFIALRGR
jgi:hypothetical protein